MKIKKGDKFVCIKKVIMDDKSVKYIKGKIYCCENNNDSIIDESNQEHYWTQSKSKKYFLKIKK